MTDLDLKISKAIQDFFDAGNNPFFDNFFKIITLFGDIYLFLIIFCLLYWLFNKKDALNFLFIYIATAGVNLVLKAIIKRPRPFKNGIKSVGKETSNYSFPSGHSTSISTIITYLGFRYKKIYLYVLIPISMILVGFSRIYLGQHYLSDVIVGLLLAALITTILYFFVDKIPKKDLILLIAGITSLVAIIILFTLVKTNTIKEISSDYYKGFGMLSAFGIGNYISFRFLNYNVKNKTSIQIIKYVIGMTGVILLYSLKFILPDNLIYSFLRYFLISLWISLGSILIFKLFDKYQEKEQESI